MKRNNNKGFSLIEVVIALAILILLITPIIHTITQTLYTSAKSKEKQSVAENARYILEYAQKTDYKDIGKDPGTEFPDAIINAEGTIAWATCFLYDKNGTQLKQIDYRFDLAYMGEKNLGPRNSTYKRYIVFNDMLQKIKESGYEVEYDLTGVDFDNPSFHSSPTPGHNEWKLGNDGIFAQYMSIQYAFDIFLPNGGTNGAMKVQEAVVGIIVKPISNAVVTNRTTQKLRHIDSRTIAIIHGNPSNFDKQAETALYSKKLALLKEVDYDSWLQAMANPNGDSIFTTAAFENNHKTSRVTYLKILEKDDPLDSSKKVYTVSCDAYYNAKYILNNQSYEDNVSYNVYSQEFHMDEVPVTYFEYQPFTVTSEYTPISSTQTSNPSAAIVDYAANDYIAIESNVNNPVINLIYPYHDQYSTATDNWIYEQNDIKWYNRKCMTEINGAGRPEMVKININYVGDIIEKYRPNIYTNFYLGENGDDKNLQFSFEKFDVNSSIGNTIASFPKKLSRLDNDTTSSGALFNIKVVMVNIETGEELIFTGMKEELGGHNTANDAFR